MVCLTTALATLLIAALPETAYGKTAYAKTAHEKTGVGVTREPTCAPGTVGLGRHEVWRLGARGTARLCAVRGFPSRSAESTPGSRWYVAGARGRVIVQARVSGRVAALHRRAQRRGLSLAATSSYRTMAHQQALCRADARCSRGDYTYVARPGHSAHQLAVAIDFRGTSVRGRLTCGAGRARDGHSRVWRFLQDHARDFGFRQYAPESWHWDATGWRHRF